MLAVRIAVDKQKPDPRDITIQNYLDKGQWKSALKLIELQGKKGSNQRLAVNKCLIQMVTGVDDISFLGLNAISQLIHSKDNPIVDIDILEAIDYSMPVQMIEQGRELLSKMWERATNAAPKNIQILESGFSSACQNSDFVSGRKLAMKAYKIFDDKHINRWRAISCCYLDGQLNPDSEIAKVSKGMGLFLLKQSYEAILQVDKNPSSTRSSKNQTRIPAVKDSSSPALQNASDIQLLLLVYKQSDMEEQALSILDSEKAGLKSDIGCGNWKLVLERLKLLKELHRVEESWKFCYQLLCEAGKIEPDEDEKSLYNYGKSGDDLAIWRTAAENVYELKDTLLLNKFQELLENPRLKKRHRFLAMIHLSLMIEKDKSVFTSFTTSSDIALQTYLDHYLNTGVAYEDLREVAETLTVEKRAELLRKVDKMKSERARVEESSEEKFRSWMHLQLNELKLRYTLEIALYENLGKAEELEHFANMCISLYISSLEIEKKLAITERRTGDEAAILAASTFIHLKCFHTEGAAWLQATLILEKLLENSKHHYGAHVMLVRLYILQACFDLTMGNYLQLNLKNLQYFTESWVLLDRIGTIFPYRQQKLNEAILSILKKSAAYAEQKKNTLNSMIEAYQSIQNWSSLCKLYEFGEICKTSISRAGVLAELSRMFYRHQIGDCFGEDTILDSMVGIQRRGKNGVHEDIRRSEGFPNYEALGNPRLLAYLESGPWTGQDWIDAEDLMFTWRRWTKLGMWYTRSLENHTITGAGLWKLSQRLTKSFEQSVSETSIVSDMTEAERAVALMLASMTYLQEITPTFRIGVEKLAKLSVAAKNDWKLSALSEYQKLWENCTIVLSMVIEGMGRHSKQWMDNPRERFRGNEWEILHYYYKTSELFIIIPSFLLDRIAIAKEFRRLVSVEEVPLEGFDTFNPALLENYLRKNIIDIATTIEQYNQAACRAYACYDDPQVLDEQVSEIRGGMLSNAELRGNLKILLEKDWTVAKFRKIARGWQSSLQGIMHEDPQHWRKHKWPMQLEKYCDFDMLFESFKKK